MRGLKLASNLPWNDIPEIVDITDQLPKKASWESLKKKWTVKGVWDQKTYLTGLRKPEDISCIVIHHSGPPNGTLESHALYHANKWGAGIAYHIAIDKGRILQLNDLLSMTYHSGNNNTYTVGIVINRDLSNSDLTDLERKLLYAAILSVKAVLPIKEIKGHRELPTAATACPVTSENRIREDVFTLEQQIEQADSSAKKAEIAYRMANEFMWLYNMYYKGVDSKGKPATDDQREWALNRVLKLEPEMRRLGFLQ
ncbi:peptidoglycan recognition family protein [Paenibacillus sp. NEAU-GSW1]|uniref:peptidoglycan recognition protein family protein n=1 Tax=Paenibacillus sp. NEAU-GSW1 TaxID=2682486 RepID=UPI0012E18C7E|nr:peptidoglycan recognition family protein [Paenibacillus sp. NEAU-GSW1]MUT66001.1 hypothetical protein [Paenibacillus sp. NEAU-GSW1]